MSAVDITVLVDNIANDDAFAAEHGLALWVEVDGIRILFDTGQTEVWVGNAKRLGLPIEQLDAIILSHGHYDHSGGLTSALARAPKARLLLHPDAPTDRFSLAEPQRPRAIGMSASVRAAIDANINRVRWIAQPTHIARHVWLTGPIPRKTTFEDTGGAFFLDPQGDRPDSIPDDQALWIDTPKGLIVLLGCAHAGVVNTIQHVRRCASEPGRLTPKIRAVIGGFHLIGADPERIVRTVQALHDADVRTLAPCHCTGETATERFKHDFPQQWRPCCVGTRFTFDRV